MRVSWVPTERFKVSATTSATEGAIVVQPLKAAWLLTHLLLGLLGVVLFPQWDAALVFVILTGLTICAGHSVGMHRLLIHRSFSTFRGLEYLLVWLGTLVGMAGPIGMIKTHDLRDWHQRQTICPAHPAHRAGFWRDAWWQLCCVFSLSHPPQFVLDSPVAQDRFYEWLERTWMLQQLPVALLLYWAGGWAWVLWGVPLRIAVSLIGHWAVGHFAHRAGHQGWIIEGLPVQGYNLPGFGLITFGENWHGNHHAFPNSARLGVESGQIDPGYWLIDALRRLGLAWDVRLPHSTAPRAGLRRAGEPH